MDDTRDELLDLVRRFKEPGWWTRQPGLPQLWHSMIDFEAKTTRVQTYEMARGARGCCGLDTGCQRQSCSPRSPPSTA